MIVLIVAIVVSMSISFFCSLMEACLLSLSNSNIAEIGQKSRKTAEKWKDFKSNIQKPIAAILIINTFAHTIGATVSGAQFNKLFGSAWIWIFSLAYSLFMIQYTEILPKTFGVRFNLVIAKIGVAPLSFFVKIFTPLIALTELLNRPFEGKRVKKHDSLSNEITLLAGSAVLEKELSQEQASLISRSLQMSLLKVRSIMVEKEEVICLDASMNLTDAFLASHIHRHTRYPLLEGNDWNKVIGYVNFKDIVTALHIAPEDPSLKGICRPIEFISDTMSLNSMLKKMIRGYHHIAVVQDVHMRNIGLVTLEDVIESLVGEIEDEYDRPPEMVIKLADNRWRIGGGVKISTLSETIFRELPATDETINDVTTVYLKGKSGGEKIQFNYHGISIRVRRMLRGYVYDVIAEKPIDKSGGKT